MDGLGSVTRITNSAQSVVGSASYTSFGTPSMSGIMSNQPYGFTGREFDSETGNHHYRARTYNSDIGRFLSRDPVSYAAGDVVLWNYVGGNPVNWRDPSGLASVPPRMILDPGQTVNQIVPYSYKHQPNMLANSCLMQKPKKYYCGTGKDVVSIVSDSAFVLGAISGNVEVLPFANRLSAANLILSQSVCGGPSLSASTITTGVGLMLPATTSFNKAIGVMFSTTDATLTLSGQ